MTDTLKEIIAEYDVFYKKIMDYDISFVKYGKDCELIPNFHIFFYDLRDQAMRALETFAPQEEREKFYELTGAGKPLTVMRNDANIHAMNLVGECRDFLKTLLAPPN